MGYYNPIYVYGVDAFLADAKAAGVDGLIVVDLPPEEDEELCLPALRAGLNFIRLATPTTDDTRLPAVLANTSGFVYYVSITGITGAATPDSRQGRRGGRAHQASHQFAGRGRFRRQERAPTPRRSPPMPTASWSARRSSRRCAASLDEGKATARHGRGGDAARRSSSPRGVRGARGRVGKVERNAMNWISERRSAEDPLVPAPRDAGKSVGQMSGKRRARLPQGSRSQSFRRAGLRLSHAHSRSRRGSPICSTAASTTNCRRPKFRSIR